MELVYRSSVNRWECDENDHLNVRFYVAKHMEALAAGLLRLGVAVQVLDNLHAHVKTHHLRFLQESRISTPLSGYCGVVSTQADTSTLLTELRHSSTDEVLCTCLHHLSCGLPAGVLTAAAAEHAQPRGITAPLSIDTLQGDLGQRGFRRIGLGYISTAEVAASGHLLMQHYMGRLSDSMPHLWAALRGEAFDGVEGGAVLEYQLRYHQTLAAGMPYEVWSGLAQASAKVLRMVHLIKRPDSGEIYVAAETIGVRMDLTLRKAIVFDTAAQEKMRAQEVRID